MDLIYTDPQLNELGYLRGFNLDLEDSNIRHDFQLKVPRSAWSYLKPGQFIYVEGNTEYGGRISKITHESNEDTIELNGRTWMGLLQTKIVCPPSGESYRTYTNRTISYMANDILRVYGLNGLFVVQTTSGAKTYTFDRYCTVLFGLQKMYLDNQLVMRCIYDASQKKVSLFGANSQEILSEAFSSYQFSFDVQKDCEPVTHLIGLGQGELENRTICHALLRRADISDRPGEIDVLSNAGYSGLTDDARNSLYFVGDEEVVDVYDYPNVESDEELSKRTKDKLTELVRNGTDFSIDLEDVNLNIGDTVTGFEELTGLSTTKTITGKILKMTEFTHSISYRTEE